ncbi:hypothetical protein HBH98_180760 [Parastagonospora nodorum]|nr:hypothetical protein HBH51_173680 [Parastagonospora nodorum]KAH4006436.1 hypothetical protein HBI10_015850 [Parastagonospora nodorum]KAH4025779.1 hypothetical protein HBI13_069770 [Parastagonospora nodorum]KAH4177146.1 hypothetical protein HBH43_048450 [Parastagonospora nodorum]KAH4312858.1 hypothetical protein HBI01_005060 [Parastagonospora nodorum]
MALRQAACSTSMLLAPLLRGNSQHLPSCALAGRTQANLSFHSAVQPHQRTLSHLHRLSLYGFYQYGQASGQCSVTSKQPRRLYYDVCARCVHNDAQSHIGIGTYTHTSFSCVFRRWVLQQHQRNMEF